MEILQLTNRVPFPLNDGGNIGVMYYTRGFLQAGVQLSMLAMNTSRHSVATDSLPPIFGQLKHFITIPVNNDIRPLAALKSLLSGRSYNVDRFISKAFTQALIDLLQQEKFDIVQLEGLYLVPYIPTIRKYSKAKISIRQHNVEYRIWERLATGMPSGIKKWYISQLARQLKKFEIEHLNDYDLILPISRQEEQTFRLLGTTTEMMLHPFGIEVATLQYCPAFSPPISLYHIGAMDWQPNQESVNWLLDKVWPLVQRQLPQTKLYLAGRNMPPYYLQHNWDNVIIVGEVPDAAAFEQDKSILLVPLLSGGGVRIKIFQGMAMGKAVITTTVGLEGINARDNVEVCVADEHEIFAQKIIELVQDPEKIRAIGAAARSLIQSTYDQERLIQQLLTKYRDMIREPGKL